MTSQALVKADSGEIQSRDQGPELGSMSVDALVARKKKLDEVMSRVMREGQHFGRIPGCGDKPTLLKPGAELLATVFGLAPEFKIIKTDLGNGHREVEIICTMKHIATEKSLGEGVGSCSTMESKYRWRGQGGRKCPDCGSSAIAKSKHGDSAWFCWAKKGGCGAQWKHGDPACKAIESQDVARAENPDIADTYNTVLKMAKKRAQIDATLTVTGASDILTQDIEDLFGGDDDGAIDAEFRDVPQQNARTFHDEKREQREKQTQRREEKLGPSIERPDPALNTALRETLAGPKLTDQQVDEIGARMKKASRGGMAEIGNEIVEAKKAGRITEAQLAVLRRTKENRLDELEILDAEANGGAS